MLRRGLDIRYVVTSLKKGSADYIYATSIRAASVLATARRCSASESKITPLSEERRPPSKAAVTFLRDTAGKEKTSGLLSIMVGVAQGVELA